MSYASTTIVDTGKFRMFPEIKDDVHYVVNVDEIANLFTVTKSSCPFKEGDFACILQFVEFLINKRSHAVLMIFLRSEYVEITEPYNLAFSMGHDATDIAVELKF